MTTSVVCFFFKSLLLKTEPSVLVRIEQLGSWKHLEVLKIAMQLVSNHFLS